MRNSNLAYKYETVDKQEELAKLQKKRMQAAERRKSLWNHIKVMCCAIIIAASAFVMVSRYVELDETKNTIASLKNEFTVAEAVTCQKTFELESMVDLNTVEEIATTKLGMQRPEKYQIVYVNIDKEDTTEVTANQVEGIGNKISEKYTTMLDNFVGIFSFN